MVISLIKCLPKFKYYKLSLFYLLNSLFMLDLNPINIGKNIYI